MKRHNMNSRIKVKNTFLFFSLLLFGLSFSALNAPGQTLSSSTDGSTPSGLAPGSPAGSYALTGFESVNLFNGNLNFALPLLKVGGRGQAQMPIVFTVDSAHWRSEKDELTCEREGAPPLIGNWRIVVNQSCANAGVYYDSNPTVWNDQIKQQYNPGLLAGRHSGLGAAHSQYFFSTITTLTFTTSDGTEYELRDQPTAGQPKSYSSPNPAYNRGKIFVTTTGEAVTFISDSDIIDVGNQGGSSDPFLPSGVLWTANGLRYRIVNGLVRTMRDRNGNEVRFAYSGYQVSSITDSLNRTVSFTYTSTADTITYTGFGGAARTVSVLRTPMSNVLRSGSVIKHYDQLFTSAQGFNGNTASDYNQTVVSDIVLPDNRRYKLFYNEYGEVARVEMPTGGAIEYDYTAPADSVFLGNGSPQIHRRVIERRVYASGGTGSGYESRQTFSPAYSGDGSAGNPWQTTVAVEQRDAAGNLLTKDNHYFDGSPIASLLDHASRYKLYSGWNEGKETKTESCNTNGTVLRTTQPFYQQKASVPWWSGWQTAYNLTPADEPSNDPRLIRTEITLNDTGQKTKQEFVYDNFNNQTEAREYDYGTGTFGALLRRIVTSYVDAATLINNKDYTCAGCANNQETIHLRRLPKQTIVYDGSNNIASLSSVEYDNYATDSRHAPLTSRIGITGLCLTRDAASGNCTLNSTGVYLSRGNATATTSYGNAQNQTGAVTTSVKYDIAGNIVEAMDSKGYISTINYADNFGTPDAEARTSIAPAQLSGQNTFAFATNATNAMGWTAYTQFDYYSGLSVDSEDINGNVSSVFYADTLDRPTQLINANNRASLRSQKTFAYDDANRKVTVTADLFAFGDNLAKTESYYDKLGRTTQTRAYKDGTYINSDQQYDALGRAYRTSNPYRPNETVYWTTSTFDALGRIINVQTPDNATLVTGYAGNAVTVTDQAGKQRKSITNGVGQLKEVDEPNDLGQLVVNGVAVQPTYYTYDGLGNLATVTQGLQTRSFQYDSLSRLTSAQNPESGLIQYQYDANGNLILKTDARNIPTNYTYDALNRVLTRSYSDGGITPQVTYTYDDATIANSKGKLTKVSSIVSQTEYTQFDSLGRVLAHKQTTDGQVYNTGYTYNLSGALTDETYPSGRAIKNVLDANGDLSQVKSKKNGNSGFYNYAKTFTYTAAGAVSSMQLGNGKWESTVFNSRLQPTQIALGTVKNGTDKLKLNYDYGTTNNNGNVLSQQITVPTTGTTQGFTATQTYTYDSLNRLKQATETIPTLSGWQQTFTYDRYGNRNFDVANTTTLGGCPVNVCNPSVNTANNRLNGYVYDNAGNVTTDAQSKTFTYDAENKQTQVVSGGQAVGQYFYDGDGKRVKKVVGTETTIFVYDVGGKMVAEYSTIAPSTAKVSYLTADNLGTPRINTNEKGDVFARHDYLPFGEEINSSITPVRNINLQYGDDGIKKKFTAYERDIESNLDFAQARYDNSSVGRFTSPDPMMASASRSNPQTFNRYAYVLNNPVTLNDPSGLCPPTDNSPCPTVNSGPDGSPMGQLLPTIEVRAESQPLVGTTAPAVSTDIVLPKTISVPAAQPVGIVALGALGVGVDYAGRRLDPNYISPHEVGHIAGDAFQNWLTNMTAPAIPDETTLAVPTTTTADPPNNRQNPLIVFHGTDAASANSIMTKGLNVRQAMNLGGGDVFWTTTNPADAGIFAQVNPSGGTPAVLQITIPRTSADAMMRSGSLVVQGSVHQFLRPSWTTLNSTAVFTRVQ